MKQTLFLALLLIFVATNAFADADWCKNDGNDQPVLPCITSITNAANAEILDTPDNGLVGGDDANKNSVGYYKVVIGDSAALQEFQIYSGFLYAFITNEFVKTNNVIMNYDNMTINDFKWSRYWVYYNTYVAEALTDDCTYAGFVIPKTTRTLMVENISIGKTFTYPVYNSTTGNPAYFERSAANAAGVLDACNDALNVITSNMKTKGEAIFACADGDCVNAITWE